MRGNGWALVGVRRCESRSANRGSGRREPGPGPLRDRGEHGLQRATARGQSIADSHGWPWVDEPFDDAFRLELAQSFGEDSITDSRDSGEKLIETGGGWDERFYDRTGPALPDQLYRALKGRAVVESPSDHGE